jgi:NhaA family Na+:H+ antiporter
MATDIAFCLACLTLLRRRVPHGLVVFVTALSIFDDIGGILVIAFFYGSGLVPGWLGLAAATAVVLALLARRRVGSWAAYAVAGAVLWYALHRTGIHPTIAGVATGLAVPARPARGPREVLQELSDLSGRLVREAADDELDSAALLAIDRALDQLQAPLARFVDALHPWVAFGVMPLFALANAGVNLAGVGLAQATGPIAFGSALGLFAGKLAGVFTFTFVATRLGVAPIPGGASPAKLLGVSIIAGIGFTVALFIAGLAFPEHPALLDQAKIGIIAGSLASGSVGALVLRATAPVRDAA